MTQLQRTTFKHSRAAQYVDARQLQAMTGQPKRKFAAVVVKELMDNALDACETAGVPPEVGLVVASTTETDSFDKITVTDNGPGIPPETVRGALDFNVLVSDKAAYRSPTRGAQGNALKTVFGIPPALGSLEPVVIEARGVRHEVRVWKDPAGELLVQCDDTETPARPGTSITVSVPPQGQERFDPEGWARAFALLNPHASVKIREFLSGANHGESGVADFANSYRPTRDATKKYVPTDPTSPHWYDRAAFERLVYSHIAHARNGGEDILLRDFLRQFKGLSATKKAKAICEHLPNFKTLSDFGDSPGPEVARLLSLMKGQADPPSHATLGYVGKEHFEQRFKAFYGGLRRFGYKKITGQLGNGLPYVFEFAIGEVDDAIGDVFFGVNYSPTFGDPLADLRLATDEIQATGVEEFLEDAFAHPKYATVGDPKSPMTAVAAHIITPAPLFLDQGKTRLEGFFSGHDAHQDSQRIARAMFSQLKPYYKEGKRRVKDATAAKRAAEPDKDTRISKAAACYEVLYEAYLYATGDESLPTTVRDLYYAVRNRIERFGYAADELTHSYFSQTILPDYRREVRELTKVNYEPRGILYEPHGGREVRLGTRSVAEYSFPEYCFDKILYVEKQGRVDILRAGRVDVRHDMALIGGQGYATEAVRNLFESAEKGEYQLFVLHDADPHGYGIARTLREETRRMPGYSVNVVDLGLKLEDALEMGKVPETFTRKNKLDAAVEAELTEVEYSHFVGERRGGFDGKPYWVAQRVELNDLSSPQLVEYVERKLRENGVRPKVIPPPNVLAKKREEILRTQLDGWVDDILVEILGVGTLKEQVAEEFQKRFKLQGARAWIEKGFERDDTLSWRDAFKAITRGAYNAKHKDDLGRAVREYVRDTVADTDKERK
jgi:hypothetical protein